MAKFSELKQYLQKELQSKKFLQEGLDYIEQIEGAQQTLAELSEKLDKANAANAVVNKAINDKQKEIDEVSAAVVDAKKYAFDIIDSAKKKAVEIIDAGKLQVQRLIIKTNNELESVRSQTQAFKDEQHNLVTEIDNLQTTKTTLEREMDKLRKKLG